MLAEMPLPVGGLMSDQPVAVACGQLDRAILAARGARHAARRPALGFMAPEAIEVIEVIEVIGELKVTVLGLVDVERLAFVDLWVA